MPFFEKHQSSHVLGRHRPLLRTVRDDWQMQCDRIGHITPESNEEPLAAAGD